MADGNSAKHLSSYHTVKSTAINPVVQIQGLSKTYIVNEQEAGAKRHRGIITGRKQKSGSRRYLVQYGSRRNCRFSGPNGAGKTTTLKMLSGLLYPTRGNARSAGIYPWKTGEIIPASK